MSNTLPEEGDMASREAEGPVRGRAESAPAHTPGPWEQAHRQRPDGMWSTEVFAADGQTVATVAWHPRAPETDSKGRSRIGTHREANARLIAAAPDLLEAVKAFNVAAGEIQGAGADYLTVRIPFAAINKAVAAITKAAGGDDA